MKLKVFLLAITLFTAITATRYFYEDSSAVSAARAQSGDKFLVSSDGVTRYRIIGENNKTTVVLVHSFNGFLESWAPNIDALISSGYRVVVYDLFGRGLSDRPRTDYDLTLFRRQLSAVINELNVKDIDLIGASFGSVIAADYATHYPDKVKGLVFLGPAGWPTGTHRNPLLDVPIIADLVFHFFGSGLIKNKVEDYFLDAPANKKLIDQWQAYADLPGYTRAALATLRQSPVFDYTSGWGKFGALDKPTLILWGQEDVSFPFSNTKNIADYINHAQVVGIENAAHWVNVEQADRVNKLMTAFLSENTRIDNGAKLIRPH